MDRCYRPLLPCKASSEESVHSLGSPLDSVVTDHGSQDNTETRKKRQQIIVACNACRKRKSKCDGQRPTCNACVHKNTVCAWTADPDAPPIVALKRKYDALKKDSQDMRNVLNLLRTQPEDKARESLYWIRESYDLDSALSSISQSCTAPTTPRGPRDALDGQHSSKRDRSNTESGIGLNVSNVNQPHTGSQSTSEAGSLDRSPSTIPSSTFISRRVSIHDLLNDGPASTPCTAGSVHSRNQSWDGISPLSPMVTRAALPGFGFHDHSRYPTHIPAFRVYA